MQKNWLQIDIKNLYEELSNEFILNSNLFLKNNFISSDSNDKETKYFSFFKDKQQKIIKLETLEKEFLNFKNSMKKIFEVEGVYSVNFDFQAFFPNLSSKTNISLRNNTNSKANNAYISIINYSCYKRTISVEDFKKIEKGWKNDSSNVFDCINKLFINDVNRAYMLCNDKTNNVFDVKTQPRIKGTYLEDYNLKEHSKYFYSVLLNDWNWLNHPLEKILAQKWMFLNDIFKMNPNTTSCDDFGSFRWMDVFSVHSKKELWNLKIKENQKLDKFYNRYFLIDSYIRKLASKWCEDNFYRKLVGRMDQHYRENHNTPFFITKIISDSDSNLKFFVSSRKGSKNWLSEILTISLIRNATSSWGIYNSKQSKTFDYKESNDILFRLVDIFKNQKRLNRKIGFNGHSLNKLLEVERKIKYEVQGLQKGVKVKFKFDKVYKKLIKEIKKEPHLEVLLRPIDLIVFGDHMHNCVGSYDEIVRSGESIILRYDGEEEACIEVSFIKDRYEIVQMFGQNNSKLSENTTNWLLRKVDTINNIRV